MNDKTKERELPSLLSFDRKLECSDAMMYAGNWKEDPIKENDWKMIAITKRLNRSTQSAHKTKADKKVEPNPVSSGNDDANLPIDRNTLKVSFTLRVIGGVGIPFACNDPAFEKAIIQKVSESKERVLKVLAQRYTYNLANGRFLWRNRVGAESISINVSSSSLDNSLIFNAYDFSLENFEENSNKEDLKKLENVFFDGLMSSGDKFTLFKIDAYVKLGNGQHVFPSQEMNMNGKGKVLFQLENCAAMHNVKIGNAIRTIDDWYSDKPSDKPRFPIAIEPFGAVTQRGQAYRKNKNDLYTLIKNWVNQKEVSDDDKNYMIGNLIRGGVFSKASKK